MDVCNRMVSIEKFLKDYVWDINYIQDKISDADIEKFMSEKELKTENYNPSYLIMKVVSDIFAYQLKNLKVKFSEYIKKETNGIIPFDYDHNNLIEKRGNYILLEPTYDKKKIEIMLEIPSNYFRKNKFNERIKFEVQRSKGDIKFYTGLDEIIIKNEVRYKLDKEIRFIEVSIENLNNIEKTDGSEIILETEKVMEKIRYNFCYYMEEGFEGGKNYIIFYRSFNNIRNLYNKPDDTELNHIEKKIFEIFNENRLDSYESIISILKKAKKTSTELKNILSIKKYKDITNDKLNQYNHLIGDYTDELDKAIKIANKCNETLIDIKNTASNENQQDINKKIKNVISQDKNITESQINSTKETFIKNEINIEEVKNDFIDLLLEIKGKNLVLVEANKSEIVALTKELQNDTLGLRTDIGKMIDNMLKNASDDVYSESSLKILIRMLKNFQISFFSSVYDYITEFDDSK